MGKNNHIIANCRCVSQRKSAKWTRCAVESPIAARAGLTVVHTWRTDDLGEPLRWIISARMATRAERRKYSKKVANHAHMVALYTFFYNFIRTHSKLKMTPAMEAKIATTFSTFDGVIARIDRANPPAKVRGPYKKRGA